MQDTVFRLGQVYKYNKWIYFTNHILSFHPTSMVSKSTQVKHLQGKLGCSQVKINQPDYKRDTVNWIESVLQFQTCLNVHREMKVWFSITHSASVTLQHFNQHHEDQPSQFCCGSKRGFSLAEGRTGSGEAAVCARPSSNPRATTYCCRQAGHPSRHPGKTPMLGYLFKHPSKTPLVGRLFRHPFWHSLLSPNLAFYGAQCSTTPLCICRQKDTSSQDILARHHCWLTPSPKTPFTFCREPCPTRPFCAQLHKWSRTSRDRSVPLEVTCIYGLHTHSD